MFKIPEVTEIQPAGGNSLKKFKSEAQCVLEIAVIAPDCRRGNLLPEFFNIFFLALFKSETLILNMRSSILKKGWKFDSAIIGPCSKGLRTEPYPGAIYM